MCQRHKSFDFLSICLGFDPAGPGFTVPVDFGIDVRLDPTDAKYVQCIYTTRYTLGTAVVCGHGNFIMNGGLTQPGKCSIRFVFPPQSKRTVLIKYINMCSF